MWHHKTLSRSLPRLGRLPWALPLLTAVACGGGGHGGVGGGGGGGGGPAPLVILTTSLPGAAWNTPYGASLEATGGLGGYAWSLVSGSTLPPGVTFDATGVFSGLPTAVGTYAVTVRVSDLGTPQSTTTKALSLLVGLDLGQLTASPGPVRGSIVLDFTAPPAVNGATTAYQVRASIRNIATDADLVAATVVPNLHPPGAPGTHESMTLSGLDPGQTLQFAVLPVQSGVPAAFAYAVSGRVAEGTPPTPPGGAIPLPSPGTISAAGYYVLTGNVSAAGTAFSITVGGVTLDLAGHTVTYGTGSAGDRYGVDVESVTGSVEVRNGKIVEGAGGGSSCHGVNVNGAHDLRLTKLDVTVSGPDADGISVWNADGFVRVDHSTVRCDTTVVSNRQFPGVAAVRVEGATASAEIDHVRVSSSPQWGIRLLGESSAGLVLVHHNVIRGTKARVANGYMIGIYKPNADVFENDALGESRGIHLESATGTYATDCLVHDNVFSVQDQPNPEFPTFHWVHGIKVEGANGAKIHDNVVSGVADDAHAEVRAIDVDLQNVSGADVTGVEIVRNRVTAVAETATYEAHAFEWSEGTAGASDDLLVRHNVFTATDRFVKQSWDGGTGAVFRDNAFVRDLTLGAGHPFAFEEYSNGGQSSPGHGCRNPIGTEDPGNVVEYVDALPWDASREWTVSVKVADGGGAPVPGAAVTLEDKDGATVASGTTGADGLTSAPVVVARLSNGLATDARGPHVVRVVKAGFPAFSRSLAISGRTALRVNLTASTSALDSSAPATPTGVVANALSASRVLLRWSASTDDTGVALYLVTVDGVLAGVTDEARFVVPGLPAASAHTFGVRALDVAGNASGEATVSSTTRPEDRGP